MERINTLKQTNLIDSQNKFLRDIGLWSVYDFQRFKFRLSSETLVLSPQESEEITKMAKFIIGNRGFIQGAINLYKESLNPRFSGTILGGSIRKILTTNISSQDLKFIDADLEGSPFITRLDLVKVASSKSDSPNFQIVEVEGDKTHAFGYVTFPKLIRNIFLLENNKLGVIDAFKKELESRSLDPAEPIILILNRSESFYSRELSAFAKIVKQFGINLNIADESDIKVSERGVLIGSTSVEGKTLVNIPSLTPRGFYGSGLSIENLLKLYGERKINVLIPPYRFLGSKGLLGLFKNTLKDPELENLLEKVFSKETVDGLRPFIPDTINVTKKNKNKVVEILSRESDDWVIKEISTSGMRGVSIPGSDVEKREKMIAQIQTNPFNFIIQRKVIQETKLFTFAEPENPQIAKQAEMFMRVSPFVSRDGICEIGLTARESSAVHGATDSIQIPVIF